eukprot:453272-Hanusia_phi.AAC.1
MTGWERRLRIDQCAVALSVEAPAQRQCLDSSLGASFGRVASFIKSACVSFLEMFDNVLSHAAEQDCPDCQESFMRALLASSSSDE